MFKAIMTPGCPALLANRILLKPVTNKISTGHNLRPGLVNGAATHVTTSTSGTNGFSTTTERNNNDSAPAYIAFASRSTPKRKQVCVRLLLISL